MDSIHQARLAQSVEHQTLNRRVVGSSPTVDKKFFILYFVASDALLAGRLAPCKWNQAWRPSELYMCIEREREKVDFKSREVNCLKECALALIIHAFLSVKVMFNFSYMDVQFMYSIIMFLDVVIEGIVYLKLRYRVFLLKLQSGRWLVAAMSWRGPDLSPTDPQLVNG